MASPTIQAPGERRLLTVMFCDLVGSTVLAQRLDPEELRDVMHAYRQACAHVVAQYDGHVAQLLGDGLMAYFGWPLAHENDAERGVRAALEIVQAVNGVSAAEPLAVRIGVATGSVVVGPGDELAVGETPNLAERIQSLAGTNEVVIAAATRRLAGSAFELTDLGERSFRGLREPLRTWRVHAVRRTIGRFQAAHDAAPLTGLVGRDEEVSLLLRDWHLARGGTGRAVLLSGEPGIGKSRLTEVLSERIAGSPHVTLRYQCSPFYLNAALHPIIAHTEFAAGLTRDDTPDQKLNKLERILAGSPLQRAEAAPLFAALLSLPTDRYPPLGLSAQKQKEKTFEVLIRQIEVLSHAQPVLLVFEDAHWIDPTSQELLDALMPRLPTLRVLLVLTFRPQYASRWAQSAHVTSITLKGLSPDLGAELAGNVPNATRLPVEVLAQLATRADGVPLFIEELTKSVLESGLPVTDARELVAVPATLNALLIERLGRRDGVRELAQIGACIGRSFSHELLAAVSPRKGQELDDELEQLTRTELVFRRGTPPDATYTFKHALVQDAAYDSLLKRKRQQLHAEIADVLESTFPESVINEPDLLAHHRTQAGHLTAAIPLWRQAGESALARLALQEAEAYLQKGLTLVERLPVSADRDSLELSLREPLHTARLRWRGWAAPELGVNAAAILALAQKQGRPQSLLVGIWGMWINTITQGRVAETRDWAQRLLTEGRERADLDFQILGHRASLSSHFYLGDLQQAQEQGERALGLYDPQLAQRWMALTGNDVRTAAGIFASQYLWMRGYPDQAVSVSDQKDADARRLGHPFDIGWALTWGAYVFDFRCEPDHLLAQLDEAERLAREQAMPLFYNVLVPMGRGLAMLRKRQLPEAIELLRQGIERWGSRGGHLNLPYLKSALAEAEALRGELDTALHLLDESLEQIERPGWQERVWLPEVLRLKGWVLMGLGRHGEAEAQLRESIDWARSQQAKSWELRSATTLAELLIARDQRDAARTLLEPIYAWFKEGLETHDLRAARTVLDGLR